MFIFYGYSNINNIKNNEGIPLNITNKKCIKNLCQIEIIKNFSKIKFVVLKIQKTFSEINYIKLRYREDISNLHNYFKIIDLDDFRDFSKPSFISFLPCIILGLPNIIMFIVRNYQGKMSSSFFVLFMNLILNFVYGNLISVLIKIGVDSNFILAKYTLIGYIILCIVSIILQFYGKRSYFDVIYNLCRELNISKLFFDTIKYNRTVPPLILVSAYAQHQESREVWEEYESYEVPIYNEYHYTDFYGVTHFVKNLSHIEIRYRHTKTHYSYWDRVDNGGGGFYHKPGHSSSKYKKYIEYKTVKTWSKEMYYEYGSWEDETQNLYNIQYAAIIKAKFYKDIILDDEALTKLNKLKNELYNEGLKHVQKFLQSMNCNLQK